MIRLHAFGAVDLRGHDGRPVEAVLAQPKRLALLAYLAIASSRGFHRRDTLVGMFWPELGTDHARGALNQAVYMLRRALGASVLVSRGSDEIGLAEDALWCDATAFRAGLADGRTADALALYRGDLLAGFFISEAPEFERWLDDERQRFRGEAAQGSWTLADECERRGAIAEAAEYARRAVALAPHDERAIRRLVELLDRIGDRAGAVRAYEEFAVRLRAEYEVEPSAETRRLVVALRERELGVAPPAVHAPPPPVERPAPAVAAAYPDGHRVSRRRVGPAVQVALLVIALVLGGYAVSTSPVEERAAARPRLAVLPFVNIGGEPGDEYFSDGLTEEILNALGRVDGLQVAARTSSFSFKGTRPTVHEVGRKLGVQYVLEGAVRQQDGRLRITVQLVDAETGSELWSDRYDRQLEDVFAIQDEIGRAIVEALRPRLVGPLEPSLVERPTDDVEAYNLYLQGRYHYNRRSLEDARVAISRFHQAAARDSGFALAYAGLADVYALLPYYRAATATEVLPRARAAARRAIALDSGLAEPHATLGWIAFTYDWDWATAEREFETALRLNPSYTNALHFYSLYLARVQGRHARATALATRAQRLDPLAPVIHTGAGAVFYHARRFDEAIAAHRHALALDSTYAVARYMLGEAYLAAGRPEDAMRELRRVPSGTVPSGDRMAALAGYAEAMLGRRDDALGTLRRAKAEDVSPVVVATLHAGLGDRDSAVAWLERAAVERDPLLVEAGNEPLLDPVRPDPRFRRLAERIGLPLTSLDWP